SILPFIYSYYSNLAGLGNVNGERNNASDLRKTGCFFGPRQSKTARIESYMFYISSPTQWFACET
ncbi:MAG: hypothetical protein KAQ71_15525, partial [Desulfobulbaceae bacterium]|nr:hypothetical protein [Desulfobulbaceae bacterium]